MASVHQPQSQAAGAVQNLHSMQISSYPGCTVLEGKPIAMPGAQAGSQSLPSSQHCPTTGMPQQHPPGSGANRPAGQQAPQRPSQAFQHMPRPPKLANFGRPSAQIRVKAEPSPPCPLLPSPAASVPGPCSRHGSAPLTPKATPSAPSLCAATKHPRLVSGYAHGFQQNRIPNQHDAFPESY